MRWVFIFMTISLSPVASRYVETAMLRNALDGGRQMVKTLGKIDQWCVATIVRKNIFSDELGSTLGHNWSFQWRSLLLSPFLGWGQNTWPKKFYCQIQYSPICSHIKIQLMKCIRTNFYCFQKQNGDFSWAKRFDCNDTVFDWMCIKGIITN